LNIRAGPARYRACVHIDAALTFLRANHRAVMATTRADGSTQMSPITVGVDADGRVVVSTRETAYKVHHLRALPYAGICVFTDPFFGDWVQVEGPVEILSLPDAMEPLVNYYRDISGEHPDWDDYRAAMERDRRVLLRMTVERAGPSRHG
jgi:PPOX class probable F420-dependent enzyme